MARQVKLNFGVAALVLGLIFTYFSGKMAYETYRLREDGAATSATFVKKWTSKGRKGGTHYHIAFEFQHERGQTRALKQVSRSQWEQLQPGDKVSIFFSQSDPEILKLGMEKPPQSLVTSSLFFMLCGLLLVCLGIYLVLKFRTQTGSANAIVAELRRDDISIDRDLEIALPDAPKKVRQQLFVTFLACAGFLVVISLGGVGAGETKKEILFGVAFLAGIAIVLTKFRRFVGQMELYHRTKGREIQMTKVTLRVSKFLVDKIPNSHFSAGPAYVDMPWNKIAEFRVLPRKSKGPQMYYQLKFENQRVLIRRDLVGKEESRFLAKCQAHLPFPIVMEDDLVS